MHSPGDPAPGGVGSGRGGGHCPLFPTPRGEGSVGGGGSGCEGGRCPPPFPPESKVSSAFVGGFHVSYHFHPRRTTPPTIHHNPPQRTAPPRRTLVHSPDQSDVHVSSGPPRQALSWLHHGVGKLRSVERGTGGSPCAELPGSACTRRETLHRGRVRLWSIKTGHRVAAQACSASSGPCSGHRGRRLLGVPMADRRTSDRTTVHWAVDGPRDDRLPQGMHYSSRMHYSSGMHYSSRMHHPGTVDGPQARNMPHQHHHTDQQPQHRRQGPFTSATATSTRSAPSVAASSRASASPRRRTRSSTSPSPSRAASSSSSSSTPTPTPRHPALPTHTTHTVEAQRWITPRWRKSAIHIATGEEGGGRLCSTAELDWGWEEDKGPLSAAATSRPLCQGCLRKAPREVADALRSARAD